MEDRIAIVIAKNIKGYIGAGALLVKDGMRVIAVPILDEEQNDLFVIPGVGVVRMSADKNGLIPMSPIEAGMFIMLKNGVIEVLDVVMAIMAFDQKSLTTIEFPCTAEPDEHVWIVDEIQRLLDADKIEVGGSYIVG